MWSLSSQYTEVRFASFLSGGFNTMAVINPPEKKLANAPLCSSSSHSVSVSRDRPTKSVEPKITDRVCTDNSVAY